MSTQMSTLMRTSEITGRPVVTTAGEDVAQVKDVLYSSGTGTVGGFTLAGRGLFAGPLHVGLPWSGVGALGADAVMVAGEDVLEPVAAVVERATGGGPGGDVLGSRVLTETGSDLGSVVDVIVEVAGGDGGGGGACRVVGYEVEASEALGTKGTRVLVPLPETIAVSGENVIVPAGVKDFVRNDLSGFGAAAEDFRAQFGAGS